MGILEPSKAIVSLQILPWSSTEPCKTNPLSICNWVRLLLPLGQGRSTRDSHVIIDTRRILSTHVNYCYRNRPFGTGTLVLGRDRRRLRIRSGFRPRWLVLAVYPCLANGVTWGCDPASFVCMCTILYAMYSASHLVLFQLLRVHQSLLLHLKLFVTWFLRDQEIDARWRDQREDNDLLIPCRRCNPLVSYTMEPFKSMTVVHKHKCCQTGSTAWRIGGE